MAVMRGTSVGAALSMVVLFLVIVHVQASQNQLPHIKSWEIFELGEELVSECRCRGVLVAFI